MGPSGCSRWGVRWAPIWDPIGKGCDEGCVAKDSSSFSQREHVTRPEIHPIWDPHLGPFGTPYGTPYGMACTIWSTPYPLSHRGRVQSTFQMGSGWGAIWDPHLGPLWDPIWGAK